MPPVDYEIMAFRLARDGLVDCLVQKFVAFGGPQWTSEVGGVILTKTHVKSARAGDAHAIA
jgi:hypothetical protein